MTKKTLFSIQDGNGKHSFRHAGVRLAVIEGTLSLSYPSHKKGKSSDRLSLLTSMARDSE
jgi:hypothetical protein